MQASGYRVTQVRLRIHKQDLTSHGQRLDRQADSFSCTVNTGNKLLKNPQIERRCRTRLGMELRTDGKPIVGVTLDGLNNTIGTPGRYIETRGYLINGHMMPAINPQFAVTINPLNERPRHQLQRMPMRWIQGIHMRKRGGLVLGELQEKITA